MLPDGYLRKNNCNVIEPPSLAGAQLVRVLQQRSKSLTADNKIVRKVSEILQLCGY